MSNKLTFALERYQHNPIIPYTRMKLEFEDEPLFERIKEKATPLSAPVMWYFDSGLDIVDEALHAPLTFITAFHLADALRAIPTSKLTKWDFAVVAFIEALPHDARIILWWR